MNNHAAARKGADYQPLNTQSSFQHVTLNIFILAST